MSGVGPEDISAADDLTYDDASTGKNWHLPLGRNEKVFQEIGPDTAFGPDTHA